MAELRKVTEIAKYKGTLYFINPIILDGKVMRATVYKCEKEEQRPSAGMFHCLYLTNNRQMRWYRSVYYTFSGNKVLDENTEVNTDIRIFTEKKEAKEALNVFSKLHAYDLSESIEKRIKSLMLEKNKINAELKKLKERKLECFKHLSTTFFSKS